MHYDLRLEIDGVLASWPIPKGPSYNPAERRLAIQTEHHPYDYGTFEGIIPTGEYGAGEVIVRDAGSYTIVEDTELPDFRNCAEAERGVREGLEGGHLRLFLNGRKLKGGWSLTRTRGKGTGSQWLFIKRRDGLEDPARDVTVEERSVLSGLRIEDLKAGQPPAPKAHASLRPTAQGLDCPMVGDVHRFDAVDRWAAIGEGAGVRDGLQGPTVDMTDGRWPRQGRHPVPHQPLGRAVSVGQPVLRQATLDCRPSVSGAAHAPFLPPSGMLDACLKRGSTTTTG